MDQSGGLTQVLLNAQSQDERVRTQAEQFLRDFEATNLAGFMGNLCSELANATRPPQIRQMAGLVLKNAVFAKDETRQLQLNYRWGMIEEGVRNTIRGMLLATLGDPLKDARSTAALAVGKIAAIEIPRGQWHDLVDALAVNISNPASTPDLRQASLEALGFVCEECPNDLAAKSSVVLGAIAFGMASETSNAAIKLAATEALANSLNFVRPNFDIERDRDKIITMIFGVIKPDNDIRVRVAAFQCIVEIAATYYNYLPRYFNDLFNLTGAAIQGERDEIALQAVEFWSTIAEEERTRREEAEEAAQNGEAYELQNHNFTKMCLPRLLPLILQCLTKQNEDFEDDTWNVAMAAGTCLGLMAQAVRDDIITLALPFIEGNIQNPNWHFREAATLAFGFILDGPSKPGLTVLVKKAFHFFIRYLQDPDVHVKDTAAWTIGRVCEILPRAIEDDVLPVLMEALVRSLADLPKVAANICWAIHNLAGAVDVPDDAPTSPLSRYFEGLLRALLQVTERADADEHNLLPSAYESISVLIQSAATDMYPLLISHINTFCKKLQSTFTMTAMGADDREKIADIQGHLCGTLQSLISKLPGDTIQQAADGFMNLFLMVLQTKTASAEEEALMAIGALANRVGPNFIRYMDAFGPLLISLLQNVNRDQVCSVAVGVVGDVARALDDKLSNLPSFCDPVVQTLLSNLANQAMNRNLKPSIIAVLGDMAMALGGLFDRYLPYVMMVLNQASQLKYEKPTSDDQEYLAALRENILSAYTSIVQGLNAANKASLFAGFLPHIAPFLVAVGEEALKNKDNYMLGSAVGLIGDIIQRVGPMAKASLDHDSIRRMLTAASQSKNDKTRERGQWAGQMYSRLVRM